jgi:integrase/recombinase XerC
MLKNLLTDHLEDLARSQRFSDHTLLAYERDLLQFLKYCNEKSINNIDLCTPNFIQGFFKQLHAKGLKPRSLRRKLAAIRKFFNFLRLTKQLENDPTIDVIVPKPPHDLPQTIDADTLYSALENIPNDIYSLRDTTLVELFYSSGLRLSELTGLNLEHLDLNDRTVRVLGKGSKERIVPIGHKCLERLKLWFIKREEWNKNNTTALFINRQGNRLTPRSIELRIEKWGQKFGINLHPHQ